MGCPATLSSAARGRTRYHRTMTNHRPPWLVFAVFTAFGCSSSSAIIGGGSGDGSAPGDASVAPPLDATVRDGDADAVHSDASESPDATEGDSACAPFVTDTTLAAKRTA